MMTCKRSLRLAALAVLALAAFAAGCSSRSASDRQALQAQSHANAQVDKIVQGSGGSWDRLTPAQQQYMITTDGHGSPIKAQMDFWALSGQLHPSKGIKH